VLEINKIPKSDERSVATKRQYFPIKKTASALLLVSAGCACNAFAQEEADGGYSSWNVQFLHGTEFQEPFNSRDVHKDIMTTYKF
jgi:hypothetical protein